MADNNKQKEMKKKTKLKEENNSQKNNEQIINDNNDTNVNDTKIDNTNINNASVMDFNDTPMDELTEKERLGVMYYAGIKALKEKIEDSSDLLYKIALNNEDNVIFSTLFFLFVILTGNDAEVKKTLLKCKEEELTDKDISEDDMGKYIDDFNSRIKVLAQKYMDVNEKVKGDEEFQKEIIKEFSEYMMEELSIEKTDKAYAQLENVFLSALKIAFGFLDAEKNVKSDEEKNNSDNGNNEESNEAEEEIDEENKTVNE